MIRLLLKRNLLSRRMFLILLAGLFLIYIDLDKYFMYGHVYPACFYTLGMQEFGYANIYYCFFFVFFATYIGSKIFVEDYKNNAISVQLMRITRKKYMLNCGIASFLSGGIAVIIPYMIQLMYVFARFPSYPLDILITRGSKYGMIGFDWIHKSPFVFISITIFILFFIGGSCALFGYAISLILKKYSFEVIIPFFLNVFFWMISGILFISELSFLNSLFEHQIYGIIQAVILIIVSAILVRCKLNEEIL